MHKIRKRRCFCYTESNTTDERWRHSAKYLKKNCLMSLHECWYWDESLHCHLCLRKSSTDYSTSWKTTKYNGIESTFSCLQIFSGKSWTSLSAGAMQFCPLHFIIWNFIEATRRQYIFNGSTVAAYSPVSSHIASANSKPSRRPVQQKVNSKISRGETVEDHHKCIEISLFPLAHKVV